MDVALLVKLAQALLQMLDSATVNKVSTIWSSESQIAKLKNTMTAVTALLLDAEEREKNQVQRSNMEHDWLGKLRDAVYDADDLFDEVATLAQRKVLMSGNEISKEVRLFFSCSNHLAFFLSTSRKVKKLRKRLDDIAKDHHDFGSSSSLVSGEIERGDRENIAKRREDAHSFVHEDYVVGRENEKKVVLDMLLDHSIVNHENVHCVSIVGVGGSGKTTLAQLVYNDERIKSEFSLRLWVCVSDEFDMKILLQKLLKSSTNGKFDHLEMDQLWSLVQRIMSVNKYFLVLDDVWNENRHKWLELRDLLIRGKKGSRILVTTRSSIVARIVGDGLIYELKGLSEENSRKLFVKMAFENEKDMMDDNLVKIGKDVLTKCCNSPLSIRVIGSLLYGQDKTTWLSIRNTELRKIKHDGKNDILPVLKLSYHQLSSSLKSCFSYCALFPKDYRIEKETLTSMWIANRFIIPSDGQNVEDVAEEHFMTLIQRCFFQDPERNDIGEIVSCKVHDLMHDVAIEVAETDILMLNQVATEIVNRSFRHLSLNEMETGSFIIRSLGEIKHIRTIFLLGHINSFVDTAYGDLRALFSKARYLRVLRFSHKNIKTLPSSVDNLVHLRYLDLSYNYELQFLPASVCELINLQTIKLKSCWSLTELPVKLSKLVNLRHLDLKDCFSLSYMPPWMSKLTHLQNLSRFVVCCDTTARKCKGQLEDLQALKNLRGNLEVVFSTFADAKLKESKYVMKQLKHLKCITVTGGSKELVETLQPHPNVKSFKLKQYEGANFPKWKLSQHLSTSLPNLVKFTLFSCERLQQIPLLSQLQFLKILELNNLDNLRYIESSQPRFTQKADQSTFFPSLETLYLLDLPKLKRWKKGSSKDEQRKAFSLFPVPYSFPRLTLMDIKQCPNLTSIPLSSRLQKVILCSNSNETHSFMSYGMGISQELTIEFGNNKKLTSLSIVKDLFHSCLSFSLCRLEIQGWSKLKSLCKGGLELLTALQELYLQDLDKLEKLEDGYDRSMPWKNLTNLRRVDLKNLPKLVSLPQGFQHLTALRSLSINGCNRLVFLPKEMHNLTSLTTLDIRNCQRLTYNQRRK